MNGAGRPRDPIAKVVLPIQGLLTPAGDTLTPWPLGRQAPTAGFWGHCCRSSSVPCGNYLFIYKCRHFYWLACYMPSCSAVQPCVPLGVRREAPGSAQGRTSLHLLLGTGAHLPLSEPGRCPRPSPDSTDDGWWVLHGAKVSRGVVVLISVQVGDMPGWTGARTPTMD